MMTNILTKHHKVCYFMPCYYFQHDGRYNYVLHSIVKLINENNKKPITVLSVFRVRHKLRTIPTLYIGYIVNCHTYLTK